MYDLVLLILGIPVLGYAAQRQKENGIKRNEDKLVYIACLFAVALWIILFSGLRTSYNDTGGYVRGFAGFSTDIFSFEFSKLFTEHYYGFGIYQYILKSIFHYTQWILMGTAIFVNVVYLKYLLKHSQTMCMTLYCYLVIGTWTFSMAGMKQILAMTISMIAIEFLLRKKYIWFYVFLFVAYTFHPYIFVLAILPFLTDSVWSKKVVLLTVATVLICFSFESFFTYFLGQVLQDEYTITDLTSHTINPLRVLVDAVPVFLSLLYRRKINENGSIAIKLGANMMIVSWLFTFMSLFGSPIYLYRVGRYFASYIPIVVPWILKFCLPETKWKKLFTICCMLFYGVLFIYLETNGFDFSTDVFKHTGLGSLFNDDVWNWIH